MVTAATKTIREWCDSYRGTRTELAARLGITRMGLYHLEQHRHVRCPDQLLGELAAALRRPRDDSRPPTKTQLIEAWNEQAKDPRP